MVQPPLPPPEDREELLQRAGSGKERIYRTVRQILDQLEAAAPWDELYYSSTDDAGFLGMELALLEVIDRIPGEIKALTASLERPLGGRGGHLQQAAQDEAAQRLLGAAEPLFADLHHSVAPDIAKLRSKLKTLSASFGDAELTPEDRDFSCEIAADLKGKISSSIMGAAASLIAEGLWEGVEIEPILFPEKAQEFERNDRLVETLNEVVETITNLLAEVPLAEMVESWRRGQRVDLYALTPLYRFLGNLGKLMKGHNRRALYSGSYHQIRKYERLLNVRINELTTLHNVTWATDSRPAMLDGSSPYPRMIQKSTELAAILDVDILRQIVGEKTVKDLHAIVASERERAAAARSSEGIETSSMRQSVPESLHPLIPLLYGEDLLNFLSLLLGAVLKRDSLALKPLRQSAAVEEVEAAAAEPAESALPQIDDSLLPQIDDSLRPAEKPAMRPAADEPAAAIAESLPVIDMSSLSQALDDLDLDLEPPELPQAPGLAAPEPPVDPRLAEQVVAVNELYALLETLRSSSNAHRTSFELVHRLLKQRRTIPPAMLQSMHPYLFDIMNLLIPQLHGLHHLSDISSSHAARLSEDCTFLCGRNITPDQMEREVPRTMDRVLQLLEGLHGTTSKLVGELSGQAG